METAASTTRMAGELPVKNIQYAFNVSRQSFISLGVKTANTPFAKLRGLLGKMRLRGDEGIWIISSCGIHMIGLICPVDAIYLDPELRVIHLVENLGRFRIAPIRSQCASVLRLPAGSIASSGTQVGDQLLIQSPEGMDKYWASQQPSTPSPD
jgi:uncharacterized protein